MPEILRKLFFILVVLAALLPLSAQTTPSLRGKVICRSTEEPVIMATVVIKELNIWATTNDAGEYLLRNVPDGTYTLVVSCLGYVQNEQKITFPVQGEKQDLKIDESTLAIEGVVVTAQEGRRIASGSVIEQAAIQHVQPTDLSDVMQLMPGQITLNPNLSKPKQLTIREIVREDGYQSDNMATLGTLLIIDGAPVSNDANMQFLKTTSGGIGATFASTASGGTDVRQIPVDNIETIEVIRGIAGVENGDILTGAVKVTLKKGKTPFTAKIKTDPGIKQFYAGKGFSLGNKAGTVNADLDYTQSLDDIRTKYKTFNRLNGSLTWSNTFMRERKPLTLSLSARATKTIDLTETDPDMIIVEGYAEEYKADETGITMNLNSKWALNSKLLTNLNLMLSGNMQHQVGHEKDVESVSGLWPTPVGLTDGEYNTPILPAYYLSDLTVDGKPYYFDSRISGNKSFGIGKATNNIIGGAEYKLYGNNGDGRVYDLSKPPTPTSGNDARPRPYKDIPSLGQLAMYLEENISIPLGKTRLDFQAGLRFTNVQPEGLFSSSEQTTMLDPRTNLRYTLIDGGKGLVSRFSLRGGYGIFSKAPSLLYLYPDKAYWDKMSFNYVDAASKLIVMTTKVFEDPRNYNLEPAVNRKIEGGFDAVIAGVDMTVTFFTEEMKNGFAFDSFYDNFIYNKYNSLTVVGLNPYFIPGSGVYYNDPVSGLEVQVPSVRDTTLVSFTYPKNNDRTRKKGVEFTVNFGNVKALRTSFVLDGAYMKITRQEVNDYLSSPLTGSISGGTYPYVGLYPGGKGTRNRRFSTNLRTITHIKELRMVFTVTTQVVWMNSTRNIYEDTNGNPLIYTKVPVDNIYEDAENIKYYNPLGYYDESLVFHEFDPALATQKPLSDLIQSYNSPWQFTEHKYPPYFQINLKLTKEISDVIDFSFYANNVTNYQPLVSMRGVPKPISYVRANSSQPLYFGAEIKIKF